MKVALRGAAIGLLALVGTATADPQTLPTIGGNVDLPAGWSVSELNGSGGTIHVLNGTVRAGIAYVTSCDVFFAAAKTSATTLDADWLPAAWVSHGVDGKLVAYACRDTGVRSISVEYAPSKLDGDGHAAIVGLLDALDHLTFSSELTLSHGSLITLPGTGLRGVLSTNDTTLPGSQWKVALPSVWSVTASDASEPRDTLGADVTISRGVVCEDDAKYGFDPPWLPAGWKARSIDTITFCTTVAAGVIQVDVGVDGETRSLARDRRELFALLASLASENADATTTPTAPTSGAVVLGGPTAPPPEPSHHHLALDWPIDLAFLSTWTTEQKGLGAHLAVNVVHGADGKLELSGRGEVGYDSNGKVDDDLRARVMYWPIVVLGLIVEGGRAELGAGEDVPLNHGAYYIGVGFRFGFHLPSSNLYGGFEYTFDKRTVSDTAIGGDPAADDRWLFYGELPKKRHGIVGFSFELRGNGVATMLLLATRYRF